MSDPIFESPSDRETARTECSRIAVLIALPALGVVVSTLVALESQDRHWVRETVVPAFLFTLALIASSWRLLWRQPWLGLYECFALIALRRPFSKTGLMGNNAIEAPVTICCIILPTVVAFLLVGKCFFPDLMEGGRQSLQSYLRDSTGKRM